MKVIAKYVTIVLWIASTTASGQPPKVTARINHVAIFVKDLQVSRHFYEHIIGLDTIPEPFHDGKHVWFSIGGGASLHVIQGANEKKEYYKNTHTCFSVPSVEAFAAALLKNKIEFEDLRGTRNTFGSRVDGVKQLWLKDPDGYWVEVNDDN